MSPLTSRPTAVLFCPGRGSYGREALGSIQRWIRPGPMSEVLASADRVRESGGQDSLSALDRAERFQPSKHLASRNASELIFFATMANCESLFERYEVLAIAGNSLGWYSALSASGALDLWSGWELVATMGELTGAIAGGQLLCTIVDEDWCEDPGLVAATERAIDAVQARGANHWVGPSIRLGGHRVLAGTEQGIKALLAELPAVDRGKRRFPLRLAGHGPFHTPLCAGVVEQARRALGQLPIREPKRHLIDGRGDLHTPWSADPAELLDYTLDEQLHRPFDFTAAVRTAIREFNPDLLLCAGPGADLRAPVGHVVIAEGWRGIHSKRELFDSGLVVAASEGD